ncbi:MAG: cupin domain-containing protein [Candidatus Binataceae bacterium]
MINERRRIITGHDKDGKSIVAIDGPPGATVGAGGAGLGEIWVTDMTPEDNAQTGDRARRSIHLEPPRGGSIFRYFAIDPEDPKQAPAQREAAAAAAFKAINGEHCRVDTSRNPGMHTTHTVDYIILLDGEVTLVLDRGEVKLKPFDVVVQRGTNHAWVNHGSKRALLVAVLIDAEPL